MFGLAGTTVLLASLIATSLSASGQSLRVYRCTDDQGRVGLQDRPCPTGSAQTLRELTRPTDPGPVASEPAISPAPEPAPVPPGLEASDLAPSPPLWLCRDWKGERYDSETGEARRRCVPLGVLRSDLPAGSPAAGLCRWIEDECLRLDEASACRRWREKLAETRRTLRFSGSDRVVALRKEVARIEAIVRGPCRR